MAEKTRDLYARSRMNVVGILTTAVDALRDSQEGTTVRFMMTRVTTITRHRSAQHHSEEAGAKDRETARPLLSVPLRTQLVRFLRNTESHNPHGSGRLRGTYGI